MRISSLQSQVLPKPNTVKLVLSNRVLAVEVAESASGSAKFGLDISVFESFDE